MRNISIFIFLGFLALSSCQKRIESNCDYSQFKVLENKDFEKEVKAPKYTDSYFVINEGGFGYGNTSITAYNAATNQVTQNLFSSVNGYTLGDITQSITKKGEFSYICVNNSQKIEVVKTSTFERVRTIIGFESPRYILMLKDEEAVVSDLYANKVNILDLESGCEKGYIKTKGWTEEIIRSGKAIWAVERNSIGEETKFANLISLNISKYTIVDRVKIPAEPNSVVKDSIGNIWILSSGVENKNILPSLVKFNTESKSIEKTFTFTNFQNIAQNLAYNYNTNTLYYSKANKIYSLSTTDDNLPTAATFNTSAQLIYSIDINPSNGDIYICDAIDYVSPGKVLRYNEAGALIHQFGTGNLPSQVVF